MSGFKVLTNQDTNTYYSILNISANATPLQICQAYKQLALKYHPSLQHANVNEAYSKFCAISQAFDVLHDPIKRRIYDQFGEQRLKEGIINNQNEDLKYTFTTNPQQIFEKFFGSKNVYDHLLEVGRGESFSHPIISAQYAKAQDKTVPDLVVNVPCTLSELYNGCKKTLNYPKMVLTEDGQNCKLITEQKTIEILPGTNSQTPIIFEEQGNQQPGLKSSKLIFAIIQGNQKGYKRSGNDLVYTVNLSLMDALQSKSISITQLSGNIYQLKFDEIISPQTTRIQVGRGFPIRGTNQKGNLIIKFHIQFPQTLQIEKKKRIVQLLKC